MAYTVAEDKDMAVGLVDKDNFQLVLGTGKVETDPDSQELKGEETKSYIVNKTIFNPLTV